MRNLRARQAIATHRPLPRAPEASRQLAATGACLSGLGRRANASGLLRAGRARPTPRARRRDATGACSLPGGFNPSRGPCGPPGGTSQSGLPPSQTASGRHGHVEGAARSPSTHRPPPSGVPAAHDAPRRLLPFRRPTTEIRTTLPTRTRKRWKVLAGRPPHDVVVDPWRGPPGPDAPTATGLERRDCGPHGRG